MGVRPNLIGKVFGKLTVLSSEIIMNRNNIPSLKWKCLCECTKVTFQPSYMLTQGHAKDCGCVGKKIKKENLLNHKYIIGSKPKPDAGSTKNHVFFGYKNSARHKKLPFTLSKEELLSLTDQNCFYCGSPPTNIKRTIYSGDDYTYNGLDRVIPESGYTTTNVVPCCFSCNVAKNTKSQEDFYKHLLKVVKYKNLIDKYKEFYDSLPEELSI